MKKLLLSLLLALPALAFAEPIRMNKSVICNDLDDLIQVIQDKREEIIDWLGLTSGATTYVLTLNKDTMSWSILQINVKENVGCIVGAGAGYHRELEKPIKPKPPTKSF